MKFKKIATALVCSALMSFCIGMQQTADASSGKKEFLDKINGAYPDFGWPFYLEGSAGFLFGPAGKNNTVINDFSIEK